VVTVKVMFGQLYQLGVGGVGLYVMVCDERGRQNCKNETARYDG
jgi:hypothetical protein